MGLGENVCHFFGSRSHPANHGTVCDMRIILYYQVKFSLWNISSVSITSLTILKI